MKKRQMISSWPKTLVICSFLVTSTVNWLGQKLVSLLWSSVVVVNRNLFLIRYNLGTSIRFQTWSLIHTWVWKLDSYTFMELRNELEMCIRQTT